MRPTAMAGVVSLHWILGVARPAYRTLRFDEDYTFLRDPAARTDRLDALKCVPFGSSDEWYATFGPANLLNLHPSIEVELTGHLSLTADCVFFWRESTEDALCPGEFLRETGPHESIDFFRLEVSFRF